MVHLENAAPRHAVMVRPLWLPSLQSQQTSAQERQRLGRSAVHRPSWVAFKVLSCSARSGLQSSCDSHGISGSIWAAHCPLRPCPAPGFLPQPSPPPTAPPVSRRGDIHQMLLADSGSFRLAAVLMPSTVHASAPWSEQAWHAGAAAIGRM